MKRFVAAFAVFASACGGAPTTPEAADDEAPGTEPEPASPALAEAKSEFVGSCRDQVKGAEAYCDCSWRLLVEVAGEDALVNDDATPEQMKTFEARLRDACVDELPDDVIASQFMAGCSAGRQSFLPFCKCSWDALTDKLEPRAIAKGGRKKTPEFLAAREHADAQCKDLGVAAKAEAGFMQGCAKAPALVPFCGCAWEIVRDSADAEKILSGEADVDKLKPTIKSTCGKHLPDKPPGQ